MKIKKFPFYKQADNKDCGPTCLKIIAKYHGKLLNIQKLRNLSETTRSGSNLKNIANAAEKIGFRSLGVKISYNKLKEATFPCIIHWDKGHFVVLYKIKNKICHISDPGHGKLSYSKADFIQRWIGNNADEDTMEGVVLLLETTPKFFQEEENLTQQDFGFSFLFKYISKYRSFLINLVIGLVAGSLLLLFFPFLNSKHCRCRD